MKANLSFLKPFVGFLVLLIATGSTFAYAMFQGGFVSWFLFYSFIPFSIYALTLSVYPLMEFSIERHFKSIQFVSGEKLVGTIILKRRLPFPLFYLVVEDMLPNTLKNNDSDGKVIVYPWFRRSMKIEYEIKSLPRGEHRFSEVRIKTSDFLGIVEKERRCLIDEKVLVYPQYHSFEYRQMENKFAHGTITAKMTQQRDTTMAVGVREYLPGDRLSWIDWKATARKNNIMTKEFEQKQSHDVLVLLDRTFVKGCDRQFEKSVSYAASLAHSILRTNAQAGFISVGKDATILPLRQGERQQQEIFYHLAKVQADCNYDFGRVLKTEINKWSQSITLMVITHYLSADLVRKIESLSKRNQPVLLFYMTNEASSGKDEHKKIERLKHSRVVVNVMRENHFMDVFSGVQR